MTGSDDDRSSADSSTNTTRPHKPTSNPAAGFSTSTGAALLDSLGSWLAARLDDLDAWNATRAVWETTINADIDDAVTVLPIRTVLVTDEVGLGGVAAHQ